MKPSYILIGLILISVLIVPVMASTQIFYQSVDVVGNFTQTWNNGTFQVFPVVQGVTSTDNIDQSLDSGWAAANTYALTNAVNEGATHIQTFTPTKSKITNISINCVATGTGLTWYLVVHDASNNILSSNSFIPVAGVNVIPVPAIWNSGNLHFHVYASATTGTPTLKAGTSNDLETASYIEYYAKNTEDVAVAVNGVTASLISNGTAVGDATGILSGAIVDTDKGTFNWTALEPVQVTPSSPLVKGVFNATWADTSALTSMPYNERVINGYATNWSSLLYGITTYADDIPQEIVWKINTMLPITSANIATSLRQDKSQWEISNNSINYEILRIPESTDQSLTVAENTSTICNGYSTCYIKWRKITKGSNHYELTRGFTFNATLNTTGLPTQTYVNGVNYVNISSNGRANSASLDPSLMANVWLMGPYPTTSIAANFVPNVTGGQVPLAVSFTDTSTNSSAKIDSWDWIFGDQGAGNTSTLQNPTHTYTTNGTYVANLTITNSSLSLVSTKLTNIVVNQTLAADFVGAPLTGYASTDVSFVDFSTGDGIYAWSWDFGDTGASALRNPTHSYTAAGTYTVSLTVTAPDGTNTKTAPAYITMGTAPNPDTASTYSFRQDSNTIQNLSAYTRTIQMSNVLNASWANGTTLFDKDHIRITRVATNTTTFASNTVSSYIINNATGTITFNATNTSGFVSGTTPLSFIDIDMLYDRYTTSSTTGAGWGTGSLGNATYKVMFPVTTLTDTPLTYGAWVTHSNFTISDDTPTSGVTVVSLTPSDHPESADRFLWNFGDGSTFLDHNGTAITHIYTGIGPVITPFSTSLTAYLSANASVTNTTTKTVTPVYPSEWIKANFTAAKTNVGSAEVVNFIDSSEFQNTTASKIYNWSFGDGLFSSTVGNTQHIYTYYGIYTVRLNVSNIDPTLGNSSLTRTDYIQVSVDNVGTKLNVLYPHEVQFSLVDTTGQSLPNVEVAVVMSNSTITNTNWLTTLFGISTDATPVDTTIMRGTSDTDGSITFPLLSSGRYTMAFHNTMLGISESREVYPQQANYVLVLHPNAALIPNKNNYINGTLYVTTPNESYADLRFSYTDVSATTTSISFYVDYANHTRFDTQTFTGVYNTTAFKSVPNVAATSYVFGYFADSSMFGNVSAAQGIMMKGVTGKLINLDPCGGYARGWGNQC